MLDIVEEKFNQMQEQIDNQKTIIENLQQQVSETKAIVEQTNTDIERIKNSIDYIQEYFMKNSIQDLKFKDLKISIDDFIGSQRIKNKDVKNKLDNLLQQTGTMEQLVQDMKNNGIQITNERLATNEENVNNNNIRVSDVLLNIDKIYDEIKELNRKIEEVK